MTKDLSGIDAIAFDLDGTLVDSAPDIREALNAALKAGRPGALRPGHRARVDRRRPRRADPAGLAPAGRCRPTRRCALQLRRAFDAATLAAPLQFGGVFEGVAELVAGLRRSLPMVVVTNKPTPLARAVLDAAGLLQPMAGVYGADAAAQRKPAPFLLQAAARQLGVEPARLLMVGDGPADLLAAHAAGCPAALVAWGYGGHAAAAGRAAGLARRNAAAAAVDGARVARRSRRRRNDDDGNDQIFVNPTRRRSCPLQARPR